MLQQVDYNHVMSHLHAVHPVTAGEYAAVITELAHWRALADKVASQQTPILPQNWPRDVAAVAAVIDSFARGMIALDDLRPVCMTCDGLRTLANGDSCPENDYDCDGKMTFERMAAWCQRASTWESGPHTREELWDI